jgi:hypothetical protein
MENITNPVIDDVGDSTLKVVWSQLGSRKWLIIKRTLMLALPAVFLLAPVILTGIFLAEKYGTAGYKFPFPFFLIPIIFSVLILLTIIYGVIVGTIFKLEKHIWLDSFFDGKNLTPRESWSMAKHLWFSYFIMNLRIIFKYYFIWLLVFAVVLSGSYFITENKMFGLSPDTFVIFVLSESMTLAIVYLWLRSYLRYFIFVFLDKFGSENFTLSNIITEMKQLNDINKEKSFSTTALLSISQELLFSGTARHGGVVGNVTKSLGYEFSAVARIAAAYTNYRKARKQLFGVEQHINNNLYSLIGK